MSTHQVTCINKRGNHYDAHARISHIGGLSNGSRWKLSEDDAIKAIEDNKYQFYVSVNGRSVNVIVARHEGRKYLKTESDGYSPNNLLNLPECP
ncbi:Protein of unknown function [Filimonas lacunae]|uniref:DUF3892 domain-containing protein n=1 Tax=Filimonas lacunae TaxID=477680 RepID=A0A1N7LTK1_9BACT|nr:DUF3892 domain-containing protein [Filimonas lacunae]SIS77031.1 Protein of unknown function [Filimonas lacunae]